MKQFPLKTCLRYPGGKSKALKTLSQWIPDHFEEFRDPFLGGGSVPLLITQNFPEVPVWVNDKYFYLYNFWKQLRDNGKQLSEELYKIKKSINGDDDAHKKLFNSTLETISTSDDFSKAISFFILNKCSYSGLTENSTFSVQASRSNFSLVGIEKLKEYSKIIQNWRITNLNYSDVLLANGSNVFVFLDPPYDIKDFLYGSNRQLHRMFSHEEFANDVDKCNHQFMITYNKNDWLTNRYASYNIKEWNLRYYMVHRNDNIKTELLITNYPISKKLPIDNHLMV